MGAEDEISESNPMIVSSHPSVDRRKLFRRLVALAGLGITGALLSQDKTGLLPPVHATDIAIDAVNSGAGTTELDSTTISGTGAFFAHATAATGDTVGVYGRSDSTSGTGVYGAAIAETGYTAGVWGYVNSSNGIGVYGVVGGGSTGTPVGVLGAIENIGVTLVKSGVQGVAKTGYGVYGSSSSGSGVYGETSGVSAGAVTGLATSTTGRNAGVSGFSDSTSGFGVYGQANASGGVGVYGLANNTGAIPIVAQGASGGFEEIKFLTSGGTQPSRIHATGDGINRFAVNQSYDGTNFNLDNTAANGVSFLINSNPSASGIFAIQYIPAGSNPATSRVKSYLFMKSNGNVGIGTTSPAYPLDVAGACHATSFPTSSDMRFKTEIEHIDNALEKVLALNGVYFKWNQLHRDVLKRDNTRTRQVGLVAQQVREVIPEVVSEWADDGAEDYLAVDYSRLVAIMIEATKEQQRQIGEQQTEIEALRAEINQLGETLKRAAAS